ncbi:Aste57867_13014 [Aphanomyces stellatus]|uniref:Aste57867_13014 protein n=1 Tax=Aphanomyces stellatus TaxID=120398 RepID=A0A485KXY6_9STRA|nr:hypothetical protein As57867_012966 [Aphanomyces stellatus]VFT89859.1 Aste57867_13014 [Aphanomyces stellatus]
MRVICSSPVAPHWGPSPRAISSPGLRTYVVLHKAHAASSSSSSSSTASLSDDSDDNDDPNGVTMYASYASILTHTPVQWHLLARASPSVSPCRRHRRRRAASWSSLDAAIDVVGQGFTAWQLVLEFADATTLTQCAAVSKHLLELASTPYLWLQAYHASWRHRRRLPAAFAQLPYRGLVALVQGRATKLDATTTLAAAFSTRAAVDVILPAGLVRVINNSVLRTFARGAVESIRARAPLPPLSAATALNMGHLAYFEVGLPGGASVGVAAIDSPDFGFAKEATVGMRGVSVGYHATDGAVYVHTGQVDEVDEAGVAGGRRVMDAPRWGGADHVDVVGCGIYPAMQSVFFTLNGHLVGSVVVDLPTWKTLAPAVSLEGFGDVCVFNLGHAPFEFDVEEYCLHVSSSSM